jgi:hypothetical protein
LSREQMTGDHPQFQEHSEKAPTLGETRIRVIAETFTKRLVSSCTSQTTRQ